MVEQGWCDATREFVTVRVVYQHGKRPKMRETSPLVKDYLT